MHSHYDFPSLLSFFQAPNSPDSPKQPDRSSPYEKLCECIEESIASPEENPFLKSSALCEDELKEIEMEINKVANRLSHVPRASPGHSK